MMAVSGYILTDSADSRAPFLYIRSRIYRLWFLFFVFFLMIDRSDQCQLTLHCGSDLHFCDNFSNVSLTTLSIFPCLLVICVLWRNVCLGLLPVLCLALCIFVAMSTMDAADEQANHPPVLPSLVGNADKDTSLKYHILTMSPL